MVNSAFNKCKSAVPSVFDGSASEKARFLAEIFSENFDLDDSVISLFDFSSRTNLKFHKSVIPKMARNVITDLLHLKYLVLMVLFHQFHWWLWRNVSQNFHAYYVIFFNIFPKESCFSDFCKVYFLVLLFKNVGERFG